jgi:hypothetical protein
VTFGHQWGTPVCHGFSIDEHWAQAIKAVSLFDKYASYRGYDTGPDGSGIYRLVCQTNRPMRMTQVELEAHLAWHGDHASGDGAAPAGPL